jgi:hypothetical protein
VFVVLPHPFKNDLEFLARIEKRHSYFLGPGCGLLTALEIDLILDRAEHEGVDAMTAEKDVGHHFSLVDTSLV